MTKPKQCINQGCTKVMYVPDYKLHMCLECTDCIDKRKKRNGQD